MKDLQIAKNEALAVYKMAKAAFMETVSRQNIKGDAKKWAEFCRAKADCMKLGVRIQADQRRKGASPLTAIYQ